MPTNPASPNSNASVDRLNLGVESPRGSEPSSGLCVCCNCTCFETGTLGYANSPQPACFEAEASGMYPYTNPGQCFEVA